MGKFENPVIFGGRLAKDGTMNWVPHSTQMCWFDVLKQTTNGERSIRVRVARHLIQDCVLVLDLDFSMANSARKVAMYTSDMEVDFCASKPV